jgi:hypothetical protein
VDDGRGTDFMRDLLTLFDVSGETWKADAVVARRADLANNFIFIFLSLENTVAQL